jgi:hypothetical protein
MEYLYSGTYTSNPQPPYFDLTLHIKAFVIACTLNIDGLKKLSCDSFISNLSDNVTDLGVYFAVIMEVYARTDLAHPELRIMVVETAISEMKNILGNDLVRREFFKLAVQVPQFHVWISFQLLR